MNGVLIVQQPVHAETNYVGGRSDDAKREVRPVFASCAAGRILTSSGSPPALLGEVFGRRLVDGQAASRNGLIQDRLRGIPVLYLCDRESRSMLA